MPVRQALNAVFARVVKGMDEKERKTFIDDLYGFTELNRSGNDALRDIRTADEAVGSGDGDR
jgi:hypothetical protein